MIFYHNTRNRESLINSKVFRKPTFDYLKYLDDILDSIYRDPKTNKVCIDETYRQRINPPFFGIGIYCYDNYQYALDFNSQGKVVTVDYKDQNTKLLNLDDKKIILQIYTYLNVQAKKDIEKIYRNDAPTKEAALLLVEHVKEVLKINFKNSGASVGILLHILYEYQKRLKDDIIHKKIYNDINKREETYYLLQNYKPKKIRNISIPSEEEVANDKKI